MEILLFLGVPILRHFRVFYHLFDARHNSVCLLVVSAYWSDLSNAKPPLQYKDVDHVNKHNWSCGTKAWLLVKT